MRADGYCCDECEIAEREMAAVNEYRVVLDTHNDVPELETMVTAAMLLTAEDRDKLAAGQPVTKSIPDCLVPRFRVQIDSEGVVHFEESRR